MALISNLIRTSLIPDGAVTLPKLDSAAQIALTVPSGTIVPFGGPTAPTGWVLCDGSTYTVAAQPNLYAVLQNRFGGSVGVNFRVPDLRGRFLRGWNNGSGVDPDASSRVAFNGGASGDAIGSVQASEVKAHNHSEPKTLDGTPVYDLRLFEPNAASGGGLISRNLGNGLPYSAQVPDATAAAQFNTGGSESRPTNMAVNYIIKL